MSRAELVTMFSELVTIRKKAAERAAKIENLVARLAEQDANIAVLASSAHALVPENAVMLAELRIVRDRYAAKLEAKKVGVALEETMLVQAEALYEKRWAELGEGPYRNLS